MQLHRTSAAPHVHAHAAAARMWNPSIEALHSYTTEQTHNPTVHQSL